MSAISLRLSESLHKQARKLAEQESISINQFIATAVAEKISALMTEQYLAERSVRGSRAKFDAVLKKAKDVPPSAADAR